MMDKMVKHSGSRGKSGGGYRTLCQCLRVLGDPEAYAENRRGAGTLGEVYSVDELEDRLHCYYRMSLDQHPDHRNDEDSDTEMANINLAYEHGLRILAYRRGEDGSQTHKLRRVASKRETEVMVKDSYVRTNFNPNCGRKLNEETVLLIHRLRTVAINKLSTADLAVVLGVSKHHVHHILTGETWRTAKEVIDMEKESGNHRIKTEEQARAYALFRAMQREQLMKEIEEINEDLKRIRRGWGVEINPSNEGD